MTPEEQVRQAVSFVQGWSDSDPDGKSVALGHARVLLARCAQLQKERDHLDSELSEALATSTRRVGEIAMLRDQVKRMRADLGKERDMRVAYDKSRAPRSGDFAGECVPLLHRLCDATRERWTACLTLWAAEMLTTGTAADEALKRLVERREEKARG